MSSSAQQKCMCHCGVQCKFVTYIKVVARPLDNIQRDRQTRHEKIINTFRHTRHHFISEKLQANYPLVDKFQLSRLATNIKPPTLHFINTFSLLFIETKENWTLAGLRAIPFPAWIPGFIIWFLILLRGTRRHFQSISMDIIRT
jgi:hypothetical protein